MITFQKIEKMKKWKIDFLEICNFSKKMKKGNERKITKNEKWGARASRAPPIFSFFEFFWRFPFSIFGKVANFQKINFPFFHFFDFLKFDHLFDFLRNGPRIGRMDDLIQKVMVHHYEP